MVKWHAETRITTDGATLLVGSDTEGRNRPPEVMSAMGAIFDVVEYQLRIRIASQLVFSLQKAFAARNAGNEIDLEDAVRQRVRGVGLSEESLILDLIRVGDYPYQSLAAIRSSLAAALIAPRQNTSPLLQIQSPEIDRLVVRTIRYSNPLEILMAVGTTLALGLGAAAWIMNKWQIPPSRYFIGFELNRREFNRT